MEYDWYFKLMADNANRSGIFGGGRGRQLSAGTAKAYLIKLANCNFCDNGVSETKYI